MLGVFRAMAGSIEGPRRVLDPIRGTFVSPESHDPISGAYTMYFWYKKSLVRAIYRM